MSSRNIRPRLGCAGAPEEETNSTGHKPHNPPALKGAKGGQDSRSRGVCRLLVLMMTCLLLGGSASTARAALQFDVFTGFDETVREGNWFPVTFEIFNDGPSFVGTIELSSSQIGSGFSRQITVELPTNTRKRIVIPAHANSRFTTWDARLNDEKGRNRAEKSNIRFSTIVSPNTFLAAAVPKSQSGRPEFPESRGGTPDRQPRSVRLTSELVPDNPIALEGINALYLTSERAGELKAPQITALITWIYQGGHLVVGVEQTADIAASPWLRRMLPMDLTGSSTLKMSGELTAWLQEGGSTGSTATDLEGGTLPSQVPPPPPTVRGGPRNRQIAMTPMPAGGAPSSLAVDASFLKNDPVFDQADLVVSTGRLQEGGRSLLKVRGETVVSNLEIGRGLVTLVNFSPDREPFRSWGNKQWFWVRIFGLPPNQFMVPEQNSYAGMGSDGIFGAMIDSRQVRKLPVEWLLLLLLVYLAVIGPVDQYVLKKLNKQMLTWITFPIYVAFFSVLIYFIASRLRAGDMEWNEIHLVDVIPHGEKADLRGRTYGSLYSPVNARYDVAATNHGFATLRGEYHGMWGAGQESTRMSLVQRGNGYSAELFVPVWTSQLFVSDWLRQAEPPLSMEITRSDSRWIVTVENHLPRSLTNAHLVIGGRVHSLKEIPASKTLTATVSPEGGMAVRDFLITHGNNFSSVVQGRRQAFGRQSGRLDSPQFASMAVSFGGSMELQPNGTPIFQGNFVYPEGLDLTDVIRRGGAVLLAWDQDTAPVDSMIRFKPVRTQKNTLYRLVANSLAVKNP